MTNCVASTLCYLRRDDETLMMHRIKKDRDIHQGKWNGLGGKFHSGETPEDCVIREVFEESGFTIREPRLRGVMTFPKFKDDEDWIVFVFTANAFSGTFHQCEEGHLEWVPNGRLLELNLWEGDKIFLPWLEEEKFFSARFTYIRKSLKDHSVTFYPTHSA